MILGPRKNTCEVVTRGIDVHAYHLAILSDGRKGMCGCQLGKQTKPTHTDRFMQSFLIVNV